MPSLPLDTSPDEGELTHIADHELIAQALNGLSTANDGDVAVWNDSGQTIQGKSTAVLAADSAFTGRYVELGDTSTAGFGFVVDEDDLSSDSALQVPTQQSVKAYVDAIILDPDADTLGGHDSTFYLSRTNHIGTQSADTIIDGTTNKAYTAVEKSKLAGVAAGATANDTDANLKARSSHTGTQLASTISDLTEAAQDAVGAALTDTATIDFTYTDGSNTITADVKDGSLGTAKLSFDVATQTELDAHVNDTTAAHAAAAVSVDPTGFAHSASTTVQAVLDDLDGAISGGLVASVNGATGTVVLDAGDIGATDASLVNATGDDVQEILESLDDAISSISAGSIPDGDKGDVVVSSSGTVWTIDNGVVTAAKLSFDPATQVELDAHTTDTTGVHGIADTSVLYAAGGTDVALADGGTGASTAAAARTNLGLGGMATQGAAAVAITGGTVVGITDLAVADGGTGASTAGAARSNLGAAATNLVGSPCEIGVACSDETTALTTGTAKVTFRMPYAMTLTGVRANLNTTQASGSIFTVDINEAGTTVLSTKVTIDNTEKTSTTAATAAVISDSSIADDAEMTIDIDQIGASGAKGLKVWLIGTRT